MLRLGGMRAGGGSKLMPCIGMAPDVFRAAFIFKFHLMQSHPEDPATEDGISVADWNQVHQLAVDVVNASAVSDQPRTARAQRAMHALLRRLIVKYGELPSLLGTKADYTASLSKRISLYQRAYETALHRKSAYQAFQSAIDLARCEHERGSPTETVKCWLTRAAAIPRPVGDLGYDGVLETACAETGVHVDCRIPDEWPGEVVRP